MMGCVSTFVLQKYVNPALLICHVNTYTDFSQMLLFEKWVGRQNLDASAIALQ